MLMDKKRIAIVAEGTFLEKYMETVVKWIWSGGYTGALLYLTTISSHFS